MGQAMPHGRVAEADYLAGEESARFKHEFVAGEIYAMAGASERHNRIAGNVFFHCRAASRGRSCRAFMSDMKLRIADRAAFYYPDVMLVCDADDLHPLYKASACFIAEVLSPSTAAVDQREKWLHYRELPTLRYYLLVDSERVWAKLFSRDASGQWFEQELGDEDVVTLACGDVSLPLTLADLYEDTGMAASR